VIRMRRTFLAILRRGRRQQHGTALVETAISTVAMLALLFGIIDFSRAMYTWAFVSWAAQSGSRYVIVRGNRWSGTTCSTTTTQDCDATSANVQSYVQSLALPGITGSSVSANTTWLGTAPDSSTDGGTACATTANSRGCFVKVSVSYTFNFITPFLPASGITFTGTSEQVMQE
jgi:Flp pilus assembly protein TadG